jgi:hypothetical protein
MPTGYTAAVKDGITFEQFALRCARAMGALVTLRDEPMDAPLPEKLEPSSYYANKVAETQAELSRLHALTPEQAETEASRRHAEAVTYNQQRIDEINALRSRYLFLLTEVKLWQPPTTEHEPFKDFMIEQLESSLRFDCDVSYYVMNQPKQRTGDEYRSEQVLEALRSLTYYQQQYANEVERTAERNAWLQQLRASL